MYKAEDFLIDSEGNAVSGATVTVRIANATPHAGALAAIYSDDGATLKANPFFTGSDGKWSWYAADNKYDVEFEYNSTTAELTDFRIADPHSQTATDVVWNVRSLTVAEGITAADLTVSDDFSVATLNNVRYANAFAGANAGAKIQAAHDDLPATGGVIDARGFEGAQAFTATLTLSKPCKLLLGNATYTMSGGSTECIRISAANAHIVGLGMDNTILQIGASVGSGVDAIRIAGASGDVLDPSIENLTVRVESGTPGQYGIHIDTTSHAIYHLLINKVKIDPMRLQAIYSTNPALTDGFFVSTIQHCIISGGMRLNRAGDTLRILNNRFEGANTAIDADFVGGAGGMEIIGNNGWLTGGFIKLRAFTHSPRIENNEFETRNAYVGVDGAMISIEGSAVVGEFARHVLITGNGFFNIPAYSTADTIRVNYANDTQIYGNYMTAGTGAVAVKVLSNALYTKVGENRWETTTLAANLNDAGSSTSYDCTFAGVEYHGQPITMKNLKPIQWHDDGGALRTVLNTGGTGVVELRGFHGRPGVECSDGATYVYDGGDPGTKTITAYVTKVAIGSIGGTGLPTATLHLPAAGLLAWSDGAGGFDTALERASASHLGVAATVGFVVPSGDVDIGTGTSTFSLYKATAGTAQSRLQVSTTEGNTGTWSNHPFIILTNSAEAVRITTGKDILGQSKIALGALASAGEQVSLSSTGKIGWDNGAGTIDTTLARSGANALTLGADDALGVPGGTITLGGAGIAFTSVAATSGTVVNKMIADTGGAGQFGTTSAHRCDILGNSNIGVSVGSTGNVSLGGLLGGGEKVSITSAGKIGWDDGAAAIDTNLYRSAANTLKTDDSLHVATDLKAQMGTSTTFNSVVTTASINVTAVGNVDAGEDNLISYSLPANSMSADGKAVEIYAWGTTANNANAKTLKVYFGSQVVLTNSLTAASANRWSIKATVVRTGASAEDYVCELVETGTGNSDIEAGSATEATAGGITIKLTGDATATNDIINEGMIVKFLN